MAGRLLSPGTWMATVLENPPTPDGPLSTIALDALASVTEPRLADMETCSEDWPGGGRFLLGGMWLGVADSTHAYRDAGGCWVAQTSSIGGNPAAAYMRFVPAGDGEVQYGFCPMRLDKRESMIQDLSPDGNPRLDNCTVLATPSASLRVDKMAITAARLQDAGTAEGALFRQLLARLQLSLGSFLEDMLRNVYSDRLYNILRNRSGDYRDMVYLVVTGSYPEVFPPASMENVSQFLSCMAQRSPHTWSCETVFPFLGTVVLPDEVCSRVARNFEAGLPPIVPQWCTATGFLFNGPPSRPCTGLNGIGEGDKILAGVCGLFNTDLMGPLNYWPPDWHPHESWIQSYMNVLDEVHSMAMPVDTRQRVDLLLHMARRVPAILREAAGPTYARVVSVEYASDRVISDLVIRPSDAAGVRLSSSGMGPLVETLPDVAPDLEGEDPEGEMNEDNYCERCHCRCCGLAACENCGSDVCDDCWYGSCGNCGCEVCRACLEHHHCEGSEDE